MPCPMSSAAAEVCRVRKSEPAASASSRRLRPSAGCGLNRVHRREVGRGGLARHVGVARAVHRDAVPDLRASAAEVRGVEEYRPKGSNFVTKASEAPLRVAWIGFCVGKVFSDAVCPVTYALPAASTVMAFPDCVGFPRGKGVDENRVDDEGRARSAPPRGTRRGRRWRGRTPLHHGSPAAELLVDDGSAVTDFALPHVQDQVALGADLQPPCSLDGELDGSRVGARLDDEVVLELSLVSREDEVDSG